MSAPDKDPPIWNAPGPNDPHNESVIFLKVTKDGVRHRMVVLDEDNVVASAQFSNPNDIAPVAIMDSNLNALVFILDEGRVLASMEFSNTKDKPIVLFHE